MRYVNFLVYRILYISPAITRKIVGVAVLALRLSLLLPNKIVGVAVLAFLLTAPAITATPTI